MQLVSILLCVGALGFAGYEVYKFIKKLRGLKKDKGG